SSIIKLYTKSFCMSERLRMLVLSPVSNIVEGHVPNMVEGKSKYRMPNAEVPNKVY
ncbi:MAG: hypothetical protein ACI9AT_002435, partial [Ulvibacter sp.]